MNRTSYDCSSRGGVLDIICAGVLVLTKKCIFFDNKGGNGAMWAYQSNLTIDQSTFTNNYCCYSGGGALYIESGTAIHIINSNFSNNEVTGGYAGGTVYLDAVEATIADSYFCENVAGLYGGAVSASANPFNITNCYFTDNVVPSSIMGGGGAIFAYRVSILTDSYFNNNTAGYICGAVVVEGEATVTDSYFSNNIAGI